MVMYVYTIFDKVANECGPIIEAKNDAVALRQYRQVTKDINSPGEFALYRIGSMDHDQVKLVVVENGFIEIVTENIDQVEKGLPTIEKEKINVPETKKKR